MCLWILFPWATKTPRNNQITPAQTSLVQPSIEQTAGVSTVPAPPRSPSPTIHPLTARNLEKLQDDYGRENMLCHFSKIDGGRILLKSDSIERWLEGVFAQQPLDFGPINDEIMRRTNTTGQPWSIPVIFRTYARLKAISQIPIVDKGTMFRIKGLRPMTWEVQSDINVDTLDEYFLALEYKARDELRDFLESRCVDNIPYREMEQAYRVLGDCYGIRREDRPTGRAVVTSTSSHGLFVRTPTLATQGTIPMSTSTIAPSTAETETTGNVTETGAASSAEAGKHICEGTMGVDPTPDADGWVTLPGRGRSRVVGTPHGVRD